jgi:hypothetical protein
MGPIIYPCSICNLGLNHADFGQCRRVSGISELPPVVDCLSFSGRDNDAKRFCASISDAAWGELPRHLTYMAAGYGQKFGTRARSHSLDAEVLRIRIAGTRALAEPVGPCSCMRPRRAPKPTS